MKLILYVMMVYHKDPIRLFSANHKRTGLEHLDKRAHLTTCCGACDLPVLITGWAGQAPPKAMTTIIIAHCRI